MTEKNLFQFNENGMFDDKKEVATYTVVRPLTANDIDSIIVTAFEGGVNYWCGVKRNEVFADKPNDVPLSTWISHCLLEGKTIELFDREFDGDEEEAEEMTLTLNKLIEGISLNCKERKHDADLDNADAITADCIIQYAVFGKIVFG